MNEPSQIFGDPKQGLRDTFALIIRDFDRRIGAFAGLKYNSPWMLATQDWADRSGHTIEELRDMISEWRSSVRSGDPINPAILRTFEDLRRAAEEWRAETSYNDPPIRLTPEKTKFPNYKELKSHTWKVWSSMGLATPSHGYALRDLSFHGVIEDRFGHRVSIRMTFKLGYGGPIWLDFRFPYYGENEPTYFGLGLLSGWALNRTLRLPEAPELEWIVGKSKTNFEDVDGVLAITRAILSYLRPTIQ